MISVQYVRLISSVNVIATWLAAHKLLLYLFSLNCLDQFVKTRIRLC